MMKKILLVFIVLSYVITLRVDISSAETRTESGYLKGTGDSSSFTITSPGPQIELTFSYPRGSVDFWVSIAAQDGGVSRYDLDNWRSVPIVGLGDFIVTVYSRNGEGNWRATYGVGTPSAPHPDIGPPVSPPSTSVPGSSPSTSGEISIAGRLSGPTDARRLKIPTQSSYLEVAFYYPKEKMSLSVRVVGSDRRTVLGDFDLDKGEIIELYGGGVFYLTIYSTRGGGEFVAKFNPAGSPIPKSYIIATGEVKGTTDKRVFPFEAKTDGISIYFDCPAKGSDIWVRVTDEDGKTILGDFDLKDEKIVDLNKKGRYLITVYSRRGASSFTAFYFGGPPSETVALGTEPSEGDEPPVPLKPKFPPFPDASKLPAGSRLEQGYLDGTGDYKTFIVNAKVEYVEVSFSYPKTTADFWVKVIGEGGIEELEDFDLDNGQVIQLLGGGTFYLKIYSKNGAGNWSAVYNEGVERPSIEPNGISSRPRYTY